MNASLALVVGSAVLFAAGTPLAQDAKAPAAYPSATAPQAGSSTHMGGQMAQMDEHMQMMKALREKMMSATTPEARQILMARQHEEMQACMAMMTQMHAPGTMRGMGGGMMAHKDTSADANSQMQMMQKRMDMMEMMMQTMMDQQGLMASPKTGSPKN